MWKTGGIGDTWLGLDDSGVHEANADVSLAGMIMKLQWC